LLCVIAIARIQQFRFPISTFLKCWSSGSYDTIGKFCKEYLVS
jgi:hypothetical protein